MTKFLPSIPRDVLFESYRSWPTRPIFRTISCTWPVLCQRMNEREWKHSFTQTFFHKLFCFTPDHCKIFIVILLGVQLPEHMRIFFKKWPTSQRKDLCYAEELYHRILKLGIYLNRVHLHFQWFPHSLHSLLRTWSKFETARQTTATVCQRNHRSKSEFWFNWHLKKRMEVASSSLSALTYHFNQPHPTTAITSPDSVQQSTSNPFSNLFPFKSQWQGQKREAEDDGQVKGRKAWV